MSEPTPPFAYRRIWVLGFGLLGVNLLWSVYNDFVPVLLQAGRPDFSKGAGVRGFGLDAPTTGFIMGLDNLAAFFILPYVGVLSDRTRTRWGRRIPYMVAGAPVAALAFMLVPFTAGVSLPACIGAIIVTLLAMDLFRTPVIALMPDLTPPQFRSPANGIINLMGGLGAVLAGLGGGALFALSPAAPFLFGALGMLAAMAVVVLAVREPAQPEAAEEAVPGLLESVRTVITDRNRSVLLVLGAITCWFLGQSALDTWFTSFAVQSLGVDLGQAAMLKALFGISVLVGALPAGAAGAAWGRRRAILGGLLFFAVVLLAGYSVDSVGPMRAVLVLGGLAWSLIVVNSLPLVLDFAPPAREGSYTGLYYLASQTAAFLGPVLSGQVFKWTANDYRILFLYAPVALLAAAGLMLFCRAPGEVSQSAE